MRNTIRFIIGITALGALAGCVETTGTGTGTGTGDGVAMRTAPVGDESACVQQVAARAGAGNISIVSSETSQANNLVMLRDGSGVSWRCLVNGGQIVELNAVGGSATASQMPVAPGSPPFIEGSFGASDAATNACRNLLESQTSGGVRVVGSEFSQAASAVYMRVGANGAPWRCLVSDDGRNPSTMFMGSEGAA